jgi:hypothetical protein
MCTPFGQVFFPGRSFSRDGTAPVEAQLGICAADAAVANDLGAAVCADEISNICEGAEEASCGVCDCSPSAESNACD